MDTKKRLEKFRKMMQQNKIGLCLVMEPDNQYYLSGFKAISYTRPIALLIGIDSMELIVPALEEYHAQADAAVDQVHVYYEHPEKADKGISHLDYLERILSRYPGKTRLGVEFASISASFYNYLNKFGFELYDIGRTVMEMRSIKDAVEIELLMEAGRLSDIALGASLKSARIGISELEFDSYGDIALLEEAARVHPDTYIGYENWTASGIERTAMPHLYSNTRKIQDGDMVTHSRQVWFKGYRAENERTFFVGKPGTKQKDLFKLTVEAHKTGLEMMKPGIIASEVDLAARKVFQKAGYGEYAIHRIGHGLGLSEHEEPYLRFDADFVLQEGMVFSIEPGLYVPNIGGFRHSDTVIVTKDGSISITTYPREVEDLIFY